jgi:cysteine desulfurase
MVKEIYLDNASTTKHGKFYNPSSLHYKGIEAKEALETARTKVAKMLNVLPEEIIFTSGGTESNNLAIKGLAEFHLKGHIITSKIEHPSVLRTCEYLERKGYQVTYLDVDKEGFVDLEQLKKSIQKNTFLVTIIYANNEIGTIQDVKKISKMCHDNKIIFHSDACQAGIIDGKLFDMLTLNSSKVYGPKGVGLLYKKKRIKLEPLLHGGGQEFGLRSGTENVSAIVEFVKALEDKKELSELRDYFIEQIEKEIPNVKLNGPRKKRLHNNVNFSFKNVEGESILMHLNEEKIYVSTGSACSSKKLEISHVLKAIGVDHLWAHGSIRFSLGKDTTKKDLDHVVKKLKKIISFLRKISPLEVKNG